MEQKIQSIAIDRIFPHAHNPRKNLGDLTELAESIKTAGILQNLTVVPQDSSDYVVIIGHRRLAAAKLAGLSEVPCSVVIMDDKTQVATMLLENIQRRELTPLEEADGFQMLIDLGDTISNISEKTGFSKNTVTRRLNMLKHDRQKMEESIERGGSLSDYMELEKITGKKNREKLLDAIGTPNWGMTLKQVKEEELCEKNKPVFLKLIKKFAKPAERAWQHEYVTSVYYTSDPKDFKEPKGVGKEKFFFDAGNTYVSIYKERKKEVSQTLEKTPEQKEIDRDIRERKKAVKKALQFAYELRIEYAKSFRSTSKTIDTVNKMAVDTIFGDDAGKFTESVFKELFDITGDFRRSWEDGDGETLNEALERLKGTKPAGDLLFLGAYIRMENKELNCSDYNDISKYRRNERFIKLYEYLESCGYETSDEEKALLDGTHESYIRPVQVG